AADESAPGGAAALQPAPTGTRLEPALGRLVFGVGPIEAFGGPALGVGRHFTYRLGDEHSASDGVDQEAREAGVLGEARHHRRSVEGAETSAAAEEVDVGGIGVA